MLDTSHRGHVQISSGGGKLTFISALLHMAIKKGVKKLDIKKINEDKFSCEGFVCRQHLRFTYFPAPPRVQSCSDPNRL